ncbi:DUF2946 family protein [Klebsiella pneumoniae]|uniref:DUF2946 family protein n=1 Tax=Klebsiella pneumoniae TaxID=573 RepID=A0A939NJV4_KLEPN|nr:DUF2946 family protein [Klebsiella pneumoniae]
MSAMPGMHHAMMMDSSSASMAQMPGHKMAMMHSTDGATHTGHEMPLDHAEACGYCVLLAHVRAPFRAGAVRRHAPAAHSPAGFSPGIKALALLSTALRNPRPAAVVCFPFNKNQSAHRATTSLL